MWCSIKAGVYLILCFFSFIYADLTGEIRICAIRVEFEEDADESTSGNGKFLQTSDGIECDKYTIDPTPHNRSYFNSQLSALDNYFSDVSYGKFGIDLDNSVVLPMEESTSYTLSNPMKYYHPYDQNNIKDERITSLFLHSLEVAHESDNINFSEYDLIVVFHAGIGQDFSLPFLDPTPEDIPSTFVDPAMILEHLGSSAISIGGHSIDRGIILPETQNHLLYDIAESMFSTASNPCDYQYALTGTFAMLTGFALGLPPLWNTESGESGVGIFGLMDQGSNNNRGIMPAPPTAWSRIFAGWEIPSLIPFGSEIALLKRNENQISKVHISNDEYFLIENRNNTIHRGVNLDSMRYAMYEASGKTIYPPLIEVLFDSTGIETDENGVIVNVPNYDVGLPASGLLIWHIDESIIQSGFDDYSINSNLEHLGIDLEESDGAQDIGYQSIHIFNDPSGGYFGDMWFKGNTQYELANPSMEGLSPAFGPNTYPNTNSHNGSKSFIQLENISVSGDTMTFFVSNSLVRNGYPMEEGEIINSFEAGDKPMILGSNDSLWISHIDSLSDKIYFHNKLGSPFKTFIKIHEQEEHTLIDVFEWPNIDPGYSSVDYSKVRTRYDFYHVNNSITKLFSEETLFDGYVPIWEDSLYYISMADWNSHINRVFSTSYNYGINVGNSGISITEFDGTLTKWEDVSFQSISGIDFDLDTNLDVLALDSTGVLYAFNSELLLMAGFPLNINLQSPVLSRDLIGDEHPEIVAKSADSSSIYIFDYQGNVQYQITSNEEDALVGIKPIEGKNSIITQFSIYQFGDETETNGNEWSFEHGDWGRSRTVELDYIFESESKNHHTRSYCYPNPIRENSGTIRVETVTANKVEVTLYDLAGYFIKTWTKDLIHGGNQISEWVWDVTKIESGVYFAHVAVTGETGTETNIIKIAVIH